MGREVLKKFGRYFLLDQIAQGGMAEIFRARLASNDGPGRLLVIKRIQSGYGTNDEFIQMFRAEIKVTMGLNHPNIVQLYDYGEEENQPYIAMEFVDGRNLRQLMTRFAESGQPFPVEYAAYVIDQAANGLHYAHTFKDKITGETLNIVHRDISPQNIIISFDGGVKVIDFGIAKATTNSESTRAGVIKGKPSYLSPEQISGDPLDGRCDVFALGIVLWELLVGKKLFAGENDLAVLKQIEACSTSVKPPSTHNPGIPKELDYIVLKALAKARDKRYQTAEELQRALHKFVGSFASDFNPSDFSYAVKAVFQNEIIEDRKQVQKLNDKAEQLLSIEPTAQNIVTGSVSPNSSPVVPEQGGPVSSVSQESIQDKTVFAQKGSSGAGNKDIVSIKDHRKSFEVDLEQTSTAKTSVRLAQPGGPTGIQPATTASPRPSSSGTTRTGIQHRPPPPATSSGGGFVRILIISAAALAGVAVLGPQFGVSVPVLSELLGSKTASTQKKAPTGGATDPSATFERRVPANAANGGGEQQEIAQQGMGGRTILLKIDAFGGLDGASVSVNGQPINPSAPEIAVPYDAALELVIEKPKFKRFNRQFVLLSTELGGAKEYQMEVQLEPASFGFLSLKTTPSAEATVTSADNPGGKPWVLKTPFENQKLPVGRYSVKLENAVLGMSKNILLTIEEDKVVEEEVKLEIRN